MVALQRQVWFSVPQVTHNSEGDGYLYNEVTEEQ